MKEINETDKNLWEINFIEKSIYFLFILSKKYECTDVKISI